MNNNVDALQKAIGLTFNQLREANTKRLPLFKNRKGEPAHSEPDGSDWSLGEWCNAVTGELGEAANLIKKVKRGDLSIEEARADLSKEFADIVTYLDILAMRAGIDLGTATINKFNEVSERVGCSVFLSLQSQNNIVESKGYVPKEILDGMDKVIDRTDKLIEQLKNKSIESKPVDAQIKDEAFEKARKENEKFKPVEEEEIEKMSDENLKEIQQGTMLCADEYEEHIFYCGFHSGFKTGQIYPAKASPVASEGLYKYVKFIDDPPTIGNEVYHLRFINSGKKFTSLFKNGKFVGNPYPDDNGIEWLKPIN